jgi:hypothetical protein
VIFLNKEDGKWKNRKRYFLMPSPCLCFSKDIITLFVESWSADRRSVSSFNDRKCSCLWFEFPALQKNKHFKYKLLFTKLSTRRLVPRYVKITRYFCEHMNETASWRSHDPYVRASASHAFRCSDMLHFRSLEQTILLSSISVQNKME